VCGSRFALDYAISAKARFEALAGYELATITSVTRPRAEREGPAKPVDNRHAYPAVFSRTGAGLSAGLDARGAVVGRCDKEGVVGFGFCNSCLPLDGFVGSKRRENSSLDVVLLENFPVRSDFAAARGIGGSTEQVS